MSDVDVITPAHNSAHLLALAVESVVRQTFERWRLVIVDDGSTDGTPSYLQKLDDPRIRIIHNRNAKGPAVARNQAILASNSEFIAFLDADDLWEPTKLQSQLARMRSEQNAVLAFTDYYRQLPDVERTPDSLNDYHHVAEGNIFDELLQENFVCTSTAMVRRSELSRAGLFDPKLRYAQDYDLWLRLARLGEFCLVPENLSTYRLHGANNVLSLTYAKRQPEMLEAIIAKHTDLPHAKRLFKGHLGKVWSQCAWAAWQVGDFPTSRKAFYRAACCGNKPASNLARAAFSTLPSPVVRGLAGLVRKLKRGDSALQNGELPVK